MKKVFENDNPRGRKVRIEVNLTELLSVNLIFAILFYSSLETLSFE